MLGYYYFLHDASSFVLKVNTSYGLSYQSCFRARALNCANTHATIITNLNESMKVDSTPHATCTEKSRQINNNITE